MSAGLDGNQFLLRLLGIFPSTCRLSLKKKKILSLRQQCEKSPAFPPLFLHASQINSSATISLVNSIPEPGSTEEALRVTYEALHQLGILESFDFVHFGERRGDDVWVVAISVTNLCSTS